MTNTTGSQPQYLTVRELAQLLRIKERKVYDLAASGQVPCSRATGKLLFPEADVRAWIERRRTGPEAAAQRPGVFLGSHDPLLDWALRQSRCGLATYFDGSLDGLARFMAREGVATGLHVHDSQSDTWNIPQVRQDCAGSDAVLIAWATRRRGLVIRPGDAGRTSGIGDIRGRRLAARQKESGTDVLLGQLMKTAGFGRDEVDFSIPYRNETDAVLAVTQGMADVAFGLEALAHQFGLHFVPLVDERFDMLVDRRAYFEPPFQVLLDFCRGPMLAQQAAALGGYDVSEQGQVRWNG